MSGTAMVKLCVSGTQPAKSHHPASLEILLRNLSEDQGIPRLWTNDKADRVGSMERNAATGSHETSPGPVSLVEATAHASYTRSQGLRKGHCGPAS